MPKERVLTLYQGNPATVTLALISDDTGLPLDLSTVSDIKLVVKATPETPDASGTTLSLLTGEIAIVAPSTAGLATVAVPATLTATAGAFWHRVDCLPGPKTALYGACHVRDT